MRLKIASYQPKPDGMRCSPVYVIDGQKEWCNAGCGILGHIGGKEVVANHSGEVIEMPFCAACGQEIGNEKVIE